MTCREKLVYDLNSAKRILCRQRKESQPSASREANRVSYLQLCFQAQPSDKGVSDMVAPLKAQGTPLLGDTSKCSFIDLTQHDLLCAYCISSTVLGTTGVKKDNKKSACGSLHYIWAEIRE